MKKIFLLEDDTHLSQGIFLGLQSDGYEVHLSSSISQAQEALKKLTFDLAIVDLNLPDGSGFEIIKKINQQVPTIVITALNTPENRLEGIELGAVSFISKPFFLKELMLKVKQVLRVSEDTPKLKLPTDVVIDLTSREVSSSRGTIFLSDREYRLLQLLLKKSPQVVTRDEVLEVICSPDEFPTERIVDNSILKLRQIINDKNHEIIRSVRGVGYQWLISGGSHG